jgi:mono/diheme cytochrome c family protein
MRHLLGNIVIYVLVSILLVGAAAFGWMRSSQIALTTEEVVVAGFQPAEAHEFEWRAVGRQSYVANCMACHGRDGRGRDQYPPLDQTFGIAASPGGPEHLIDLTLHGLASERWRAPMPPMGHMPDVEIAAVLNHVIATSARLAGTPPPSLLVPADVAARRGQRLSPRDVERQRPVR